MSPESSLFVGARLPRQQQCEDGVHMKPRCFPLRGDHNLLTPDTHTPSGVGPCEQVESGGVASLSGHLSDSSSGQSAARLTRRRPAASPTRRLRFEDETEKEAESRYLERQQQKKRVGQRGTGVLGSKPDLNLYINSMVGAGHVGDKQPRGRTVVRGAGQSHTCGTGLGGGVNLWLHPPGTDKGWSLNRHHLNMRTEPIRETYIGSVTGGERGGAYMQVRRQSVELNGAQVTLHQTTPITSLPINPYSPHRVGLCAADPPTFRCPSHSCHHSVTSVTSQENRANGAEAGQEERGRPLTATLHREREPRERRVCEEEEGLNNTTKNCSSSSSSERSSDTTAESHTLPTSEPMRAALHRDDISLPAHLSNRNDSSRLSLRRLFSTVTLRRTQTGSLDRLSSRTRPSLTDPASSISRNSSNLLKKSPSVELLSVQEAPLLQSKKSSLELKKKKKDRSADYKPAADQFLPRSLSVEDVGRPSSVRSVGRVLRVCSDGTFLLELHQPWGRTFGFIISRGKGQCNSGVYVEDMVDSSTEKLYAGLLAVGDEILEVNGEKVACLSLDQVTHLLIQNPSATIRVLRHQKTSSQ